MVIDLLRAPESLTMVTVEIPPLNKCGLPLLHRKIHNLNLKCPLEDLCFGHLVPNVVLLGSGEPLGCG